MIKDICKKIVFDERNIPIEVIISYEQWKEIEAGLKPYEKGISNKELEKYKGVLQLREEPLKFQKRIRDEWN